MLTAAKTMIIIYWGAPVNNRILSEMGDLRILPGTVAVWFLGQSGVAIKTRHGILYIDPYCSDYVERITRASGFPIVRRYPSLLEPEALHNADLVLISHDHEDHLDLVTLPTLAQASTVVRFVLPGRSAQMLAAAGVATDRMITPHAWEAITPLPGLAITPVPAAHEDFQEEVDLGHRFFGYLVEADDVHLYHSGDTVVYSGLAEELRKRRIDLALVAINGRDFFRTERGIVGNMTSREAAELAGSADFDVTIPLHYDMFEGNGEDPGHFIDMLYRLHPERSALVLGRGACFVYTGRRRGYTAQGSGARRR